MNKTTIAFIFSIFLSLSATAADKNGMSGKGQINVNQATVEQLDKGLLGVGPRIAMEIVKHRNQHGPYQSVEDLDKVKYVGSRMLDKNKGRIIFD